MNLMRQKSTARALLGGVFFLSIGAGCAGISAQSRQMLQEPASCENAGQDIQTLQQDRAGALERVGQGLQGILPPAVVISLLRDAYGKPFRSIYLDHWRIAFGSYNGRIDARVRELQECR